MDTCALLICFHLYNPAFVRTNAVADRAFDIVDHSTETAVLRVLSYLLEAVDKGDVATVTILRYK